MLATGKNLFEEISGAHRECLLVSPFIKVGAFKRLVSDCPKSCLIRVVTRWRLDELAGGVNDLEVWNLLCERTNFEYWLQPRLHAKYFRIDDCIYLGSANLTDSGLGWSNNPNLEILERIGYSYPDRTNFESRVFQDAVQVDEELYIQFREALANYEEHVPTTKSSLLPNNCNPSWRPTLRRPQELYKCYRGDTTNVTVAVRESASYDLSSLGVPSNLSERSFNNWVKLSLLQNSEFRDIDSFVVNSRRFGEMKNFLRSRGADNGGFSWQTWMRWILHFLPGHFVFHQPNYSEVVSRVETS